VLFADLVDSTGLYARLGQTRARDLIARCLGEWSTVARNHGGVVIKTIGDEVMCRFASAGDALRAACQMQEALEADAVFSDMRLMAHVGVHYGLASIDEDDVHGDAANVAASMTRIAKPRQIITTEHTVKQLPPDTAAQARLYDLVTLTRGQPQIAIFEVLWDQENATRILTRADLAAQTADVRLHLRYRASELMVTADTFFVLLGRDRSCNLVVDADLVSRVHARIEYRRGKFVLIDQSTNGTFVTPQDRQQVYLRREEMPLTGCGSIGLGQAPRADGANVVHYAA
jgi:adenylate cyclase